MLALVGSPRGRVVRAVHRHCKDVGSIPNERPIFSNVSVFKCYLSDEPETRDSWWREIRTEIRSHAKALGCHAVVGYSESTTIW